MVASIRRWFLLAAVPGLLAAVIPAGPAESAQESAQEPAGEPVRECAATGYLVGSDAELAQLQEELGERGPHQAGGVPLDRVRSWVIPDGDRPVLVLDTAGPVLSGGDVSVVLAGQRFRVSTSSFDAARDRFISTVDLPHLGSTVRTLGLAVDAGPCQLAVALTVDRPVWTTLVGGAGIALAGLGAALAVLVGRRRTGGWGRRFGFAAPLGLLAGAGLAVVLLETAAVAPFDGVPWWPAVAGLALAAVLPLTRWRSRQRSAAGLPGGQWPVPAHAPLAGYRLDEVLTVTDATALYRATRVRVPADPTGAGGPDRALLKVVVASRYGDPAARLRIDREVAALSGLAHPNLLRLREAVPAAGGGGPATLVFEDVAGAPLRQLLRGGGGLSGPQAVNVGLGLLAGVAAVHARGLVHRDIRPEQVWLTVDGTVLLGGFELACAGVEHSVAPDLVEPYASPEQRAGRVLDGRSDLWACGLLLVELLTGAPRPDPAGLPDPLARVLSRVLAEDPAGRPATAEQFAAELRDAAAVAFGADWPGRGALAGAVLAYGAIGAATGGYALAGAAGGAGIGAGAGAGAGAGVVGIGAAGGGASTGVAGIGAAAVNVAVAVVAGVALAAGAALASPEPAQAQPVVITPEQAQVIFIRTVEEARDRVDDHLGEGVLQIVTSLLDEDEAIADAELTGVVVGVPPDQRAYPAWFVASAQIRYRDDQLVYLASRFDRESAEQPWLMTGLAWSYEDLGTVEVDEDGWLVPQPEPAELVLDPAELPQRYAGWLDESWRTYQLADDELLQPRDPDSSLIASRADNAAELYESGNLDQRMSIRQETTPEPAEPVVVLLSDGRALVSFYAVMEQTGFNRPGHTSGPCDDEDFSNFGYGDVVEDDDRDYRELGFYTEVHVLAWVPPADPAEAEAGPVLVDDRTLDVSPRPERSVLC
ncbi:MAG: protein kinase [Micromonosporaceae bacterium]|nr:protein kinase [Micromonosporaceae bacterium]